MTSRPTPSDNPAPAGDASDRRPGRRRARTWLAPASAPRGCGSRSPKASSPKVYYPRIDIPQIKDLGFIVADDKGFWVEIRRNHNYVVTLPSPGVPAVEIVHRHPRFMLHAAGLPFAAARRAADPGQARGRRVAAGLTRCWRRGWAARRQTTSRRSGLSAAARCCGRSRGRSASRSRQWTRTAPTPGAAVRPAASGTSDGWTDFDRNGRMTWQYTSAGPTAVALMGELPQQATLALGLGDDQGGGGDACGLQSDGRFRVRLAAAMRRLDHVAVVGAPPGPARRYRSGARRCRRPS